MRIAYVGNFHNFGTSIATAGTALVYLMSKLEEVESVDVFCPNPNAIEEETFIPDKVKIKSIYDPNKLLSTLNLYTIKWKKYDRVIFNMLPTSFGKSALLNIIGLLAPYLLTKIGNANIKVIYHNSTLTNDVELLGYNSKIDMIKKFVLSKVEMCMFTTLPTYMPLRLYVDKVISRNENAIVHYVNMRYFEGIPTIFINGVAEKVSIKKRVSSKKTILLHGYWGPQKNLVMALQNLTKLRKEGLEFHLILSGDINGNFPGYGKYFSELIEMYSATIDEKLGYVSEKEILQLFLRSDLVIIPYNVSGGHSGVLETAITFRVPAICIRHPESEEQAAGFDEIALTDSDHLFDYIRLWLDGNLKFERNPFIPVSEMIIQAIESTRSVIK